MSNKKMYEEIEKNGKFIDEDNIQYHNDKMFGNATAHYKRYTYNGAMYLLINLTDESDTELKFVYKLQEI